MCGTLLLRMPPEQGIAVLDRLKITDGDEEPSMTLVERSGPDDCGA